MAQRHDIVPPRTAAILPGRLGPHLTAVRLPVRHSGPGIDAAAILRHEPGRATERT